MAPNKANNKQQAKEQKVQQKKKVAEPEPEPETEPESEVESESEAESAIGMVPWAVVTETQGKLADKLEISQKDLKLICDTFMNAVIQRVQNDESVCFRGNMTLKRVLRKERTHRNPKTGEEILKPAHYSMKLELKPALKEAFADLEVEEDDEE